MKIKKGDKVRITTGKDKGKEGPVLHAYPKDGRVVIEGLNLYKKHVRPRRAGEKGEVVLRPRPINVSNVMLICPSCKQPTRIGFSLAGDKKSRICRKCQAAI